jgi:hypothetical protein
LPARTGVLVVIMLVAYALAAPVAWFGGGTDSLFAAAVALAVCLGGGLAALVACELLRGPHQVLSRLVLGMLLRMGVPLGIFLIIHQQGGLLVEAGIVYYLVPFYLVMLGVETLMAARQIPATPGGLEGVNQDGRRA